MYERLSEFQYFGLKYSYSENQKTLDKGDDIKAKIKNNLCCYKAKNILITY